MCMVLLLVHLFDLGIRLDETNCSISVHSRSSSPCFIPPVLTFSQPLIRCLPEKVRSIRKRQFSFRRLQLSITDVEGQNSMKLKKVMPFSISFIFFKGLIVEISILSPALASTRLVGTPCMSPNCREKQCGLYGCTR